MLLWFGQQIYTVLYMLTVSNPVKSSNYIFPLSVILMSFVIIYRANANANGNETIQNKCAGIDRENGKEKRCFHCSNTIWWLFTKLAFIIYQCPAHVVYWYWYAFQSFRSVIPFFSQIGKLSIIFPYSFSILSLSLSACGTHTKLCLISNSCKFRIINFVIKFELWVTVCCTRNACQLITH